MNRQQNITKGFSFIMMRLFVALRPPPGIRQMLAGAMGGGVVCWRECEVLDWIAALPKTGPENKTGVGEGVAA